MTHLPDHARWQAVRTRDPSAHSSFIYAITTTRIYCRPTCPARLARRANVIFFDTPDVAAAAGFRACKRCKPESSTAGLKDRQRDAVKQACEIMRQSQGATRLQDIAKQVGLSQRYLHGIFKETMGVTPAQYAKDCRGAGFKDCVSSSVMPLSNSTLDTPDTNITSDIVGRGLSDLVPKSPDIAIDAILGMLQKNDTGVTMDGEMDIAVSQDPFDACDAAVLSLLGGFDPPSVNNEAYLDPCFEYLHLEV